MLKKIQSSPGARSGIRCSAPGVACGPQTLRTRTAAGAIRECSTFTPSMVCWVAAAGAEAAPLDSAPAAPPSGEPGHGRGGPPGTVPMAMPVGTSPAGAAPAGTDWQALAVATLDGLGRGLVLPGPEQPLLPLVLVLDVLDAQEPEAAQQRQRQAAATSRRRWPSWAARTAQAIVRLLQISTIVLIPPSVLSRNWWA